MHRSAMAPCAGHPPLRQSSDGTEPIMCGATCPSSSATCAALGHCRRRSWSGRGWWAWRADEQREKLPSYRSARVFLLGRANTCTHPSLSGPLCPAPRVRFQGMPRVRSVLSHFREGLSTSPDSVTHGRSNSNRQEADLSPKDYRLPSPGVTSSSPRASCWSPSEVKEARQSNLKTTPPQ